MNAPSQFDFWYAINNTRVVVAPVQRLETFGATIIHYHLVSELMDSINKIRVREGRIVAQRPQIITPTALTENMLEGFGAEAEKYMDWLRENSQNFRMLQYGFVIRKEEINDEIITDTLEAVLDRVAAAVRQKDEPLTAVVAGVDSPWEVSLLKMMFEVSNNSFQANVREMESHRMFTPNAGLRFEIETEFQLAGRQPARITELGNKLQKHGLFPEYEDRFFALIKAKQARKQ
ncbi:MAG: hypothetical protein WCS52_01585 [bacterium]